jgi:hypothetical protein
MLSHNLSQEENYSFLIFEENHLRLNGAKTNFSLEIVCKKKIISKVES